MKRDERKIARRCAVYTRVSRPCGARFTDLARKALASAPRSKFIFRTLAPLSRPSSVPSASAPCNQSEPAYTFDGLHHLRSYRAQHSRPISSDGATLGHA